MFVNRIAWETYAMLVSDLVVVSTTDEKDKLLSDYSILEDKIKIIPPGINRINLERVEKSAARKLLKLPQDASLLMSLGRLDSRKGYDNTIKAFSELLNLNPQKNLKLVIFAGNNLRHTQKEKLYLLELKSLAKQLKVEDKVIFKDSVDYKKVHLIYAACDYYLCLSNYEPFGISILEAMFIGIPVIATLNGGPKNIITHKKTGFLVKPDNPQKVAEYLSTLLTDPKLYKKITLQAQSFVSKNYTWEAVAQNFYSTYSNLLELKQGLSREELLKYLAKPSLSAISAIKELYPLQRRLT